MASYSATDYLLDRANIEDTITRMAWYVDRKEWDKVPSVFADDLVMDYTSLLGGEPYNTTPVAQAQVWRGMLDYIDVSLHAVTGVLVDLPQPLGQTHPTEASAACSPLITLRRNAAHGDPITQSGATWSFKLIKSNKAGNPWRISFMKADVLFMTGNADVAKNPETGKGWL
ncbi:hypothetical protein B0H11DRAFT_2213621 [Mycena galericulata]|nr:hypothetical protein B0H11DRAFT_2213621 [Mycena galericulata]